MVGFLQLRLAVLLAMAKYTYGGVGAEPATVADPQGSQAAAGKSDTDAEHKIWHHLEKLRKSVHKEEDKERKLEHRLEKLERHKIEHERKEEELADKLKQLSRQDAERRNGSTAPPPPSPNRTQELELYWNQQHNGSAAGQQPNISVTPHPSLNQTGGPVRQGSPRRNGSAASPQPESSVTPRTQRPNQTRQPVPPGRAAALHSANGSAAPRPQSPNRTGERAGPQGPQRNGTARPPPRGHLRNGSATSRNRSRHQAGTQLPEQGVTPPARIAREAKRHTAALALAALVGGCCLSVSFWVALSVCVAAVRACPERAAGGSMRTPLLAA
mmetsp:Transcript_26532/g.72854  ORF Transcript_26532/g.72854 Transcript_26532/m.72854 type:complete len:328 (-) Transcript_26532:278-1261(-)